MVLAKGGVNTAAVFLHDIEALHAHSNLTSKLANPYFFLLYNIELGLVSMA